LTIGFLSHLDLNLYAFRLPVMLELKRLGHTPIAIAPEGEYLNKMRDLGIKCVPYEISRKSLNPLKELKAIQNIYQAVKPLKLDILHSFTAKPNIYGTIAGKIAGVPKIINLVEGLGSFYLEDDPKSRVVRNVIEQLYKQIFKLSDTVMFVNSDDPEYMVSKKIVAPQKVFKIDGVGIDTDEWISDFEPLEQISLETSYPRQVHQKANADSTCRAKVSLSACSNFSVNVDEEMIKIIMVGRAIRHKGVVEYYESAKIIKEKYPNAHFVYVGGVDEGNHSALSEEYMRSNPAVEYLGERSDVRELIDSVDIFVLPSYREGLPRTILEAMSLAKPIVATNVSGCRDCVADGETGYLVEPKNVTQLSEAIEKLIIDKEKRVKFGSLGRKLAVRRFDVKAIVKEHLRIYGIE
jgi:N,N'-diacetylbacillosaminyl-diphospho-undecaprenol alpha-1,3-N-acetylgalactosaminyltransferase